MEQHYATEQANRMHACTCICMKTALFRPFAQMPCQQSGQHSPHSRFVIETPTLTLRISADPRLDTRDKTTQLMRPPPATRLHRNNPPSSTRAQENETESHEWLHPWQTSRGVRGDLEAQAAARVVAGNVALPSSDAPAPSGEMSSVALDNDIGIARNHISLVPMRHMQYCHVERIHIHRCMHAVLANWL